MDFKKINIKKVKKISYWIVLGFLLVVLIFVLFPLLPIDNNYSLKMVLSGSMSPTIKTGSIIAVKPASSYKIGDIITFKVGKREREIVTHRIISQTEQDFIVQGDANNAADINPVRREQILGKVFLTIPYAGYMANFAHSKFGLVLLILIPALLIIGCEIKKIISEISKIKDKKQKNTNLKMPKLFTKIVLLALIIGLNWSGISAIGETFSFFSNTENSTNNIFQAGILDMTVRSGQNNFTPNAENMIPGGQVNRDIYIGKTAISSSLKHKVSFEFISGNKDLCSQLDLKIWYDHYKCQGSYADCRDMRLTYNGKLSALSEYNHDDFIIPHPDDQFDTDSSDGTEQWFYYSINLPAGISNDFEGEVCKFNFVFDGWQTNFPDNSLGFTDKEELESTIKVSYWEPFVVLNEFLPNAGNYPEFIEIYNQTTSPINLDNFYVMANANRIDINSANTSAYSSGLTTIDPHGWLVITAGGNLLNNNSGTLTLYNPNGVEVDFYTYSAGEYNINNSPGWTNNIVAYWPFDGDVEDKSGNGNNGTNYGAIPVAGKINQALSFDGDDYIVVDDSSSLETTLVTLEAWVKSPNSPGSYKYIAGKYYGDGWGSYHLYTGPSGGLKFYIGHSGGYVASPDAGTGIWDNNWHHITGTYDGFTVKLYVDGAEISGGTGATEDIAYNTENFYIGSYGNGYYFNGLIDEVKIYNRALSADEVWKHFNAANSLGSVPVDKSYARIPDGSSNWVDPFPTPGGPNVLGPIPITDYNFEFEEENSIELEQKDLVDETEETEENIEDINNEITEIEQEPIESFSDEELDSTDIEGEVVEDEVGDTGEEDVFEEINNEIEGIIENVMGIEQVDSDDEVVEEAINNEEIIEEDTGEEIVEEEIVEEVPIDETGSTDAEEEVVKEEPAEEEPVEEIVKEEEPAIEPEEIIIEENESDE